MPDYIDLRSDTVTRPTPEMRRAMFEAEVGDDVYGEDPTVNQLEAEAAALVGKEAALLCTSGTQGNQIAIMLHTHRGDEVICEAEAHSFLYEVGGVAAICQAQARPLAGVQGMPPLAAIAAALRGKNVHYPDTALLTLENTHNRAGGTVLPQDEVEAACRLAHAHGARTHLDGARIFNAAIATGRPAAVLCAPFDTVQFCLSKGLGAPIGSILAGSRQHIDQARRYRKMLGGGMRQAGILAAAGLVALHSGIERLAADHANARWLGEAMNRVPGLRVDLETVQTNMVFFEITDPEWDGDSLTAALQARGVLTNATGPRWVRLVTHRDVSRAQVEQAAQVIADVVAAHKKVAAAGSQY